MILDILYSILNLTYLYLKEYNTVKNSSYRPRSYFPLNSALLLMSNINFFCVSQPSTALSLFSAPVPASTPTPADK